MYYLDNINILDIKKNISNNENNENNENLKNII